MGNRYVVCAVDEIPPGTKHTIEISRRSIVIFNVGGKFYAVRDRCPHQGACLSGGDVLTGKISASRPGAYETDPSRHYVRCPWHGWEYELGTGQSYFDPERNRVRPYDISVASGKEVRNELSDDGQARPGPYVAETYEIKVEDDYVVVEV